MPLKEIQPNLYVGGIGDFGNATELASKGIELAVVFHGSKGFPHATVPAAAFYIRGDGVDPDWYIRGIVDCLLRAYGLKNIALADERGGLNRASFFICCAYAQKQGQSWNAGKTWLDTKISDVNIDAALVSQGQALWP